MNNIGERIKKARSRIGLSQMELAQKANVSQPTIANWENGSHIPRHATIDKLAKLLETSPHWLGSGVGENPDEDNLPAKYLGRPIRHIPIMAWPDISHIDNDILLPGEPKDYLASSIECKDPFALIANDPAMAALFPVGALIVFDRECKLQEGKTYLFSYNGKIILRRWQNEPDRLEALPNLSAVDSIILDKRPFPLARAILSLRQH